MTTTPLFGAPRIDAALIDLDGTMVDTADDFTAGLNAMLAQLDAQETTREEVMRYVGKGSENLIQRVLTPRFSEDEAKARFDEALALYQAEYAKINGRHTRLYPDVEAGLHAMRDAGVKLACVTNKPHRFAVELLAQYGLRDYFGAVFGGDSAPRKKPDPAPMLAACVALGVAPRATVAIGDSENDALAGRAAGMATLTVPYGYNHGNAIQTIESDGIVDSLFAAAQVVIAHNSAKSAV
ncbi:MULTISPECIES: phosphoglycolate phosphatase [Burkholderia]|uniref:Phosphoglycolate phosphatase n=1 Tax=Burkholderia savannae TaxID=1637837 RepID=A0ABR5TI63_9BURK|nr:MULTISPECIES: phosphoglycolate phosphatase [Burkholderia]AOJ82468.1 phosphoglycolate phosphatase [Burkholderia savannae]AOK48624.1 phosphoglycolate phosphatase [Burkholderia sp. MSMB617WGS]KGS03825.1 phosphoglycolate phosphatase, bacterial [Burkholderia sp. ABCPW 111]KVK72748.1 phosphoglycolate phosphatase [Burkholderia sp. MSMB1498]KWZ44676.1 phosphoglycolate phosphatase [Burkholderia savannae]